MHRFGPSLTMAPRRAPTIRTPHTHRRAMAQRNFYGFNLHASVRIAADDDRGRDRLFRYCLRPPFSLDRLGLLPDGRCCYHVKKSGRRTSQVRIMTAFECLARIRALIPPPDYPLTRFHCVSAPRSKLRKAIVPRPRREVRPACCAKSKAHDASSDTSVREHARGRKESAASAKEHATGPTDNPVFADASREILPMAHVPLGARMLGQMLSGSAEVIEAHNVLSVKHWDRMGRGELCASTSAVPWAILHARTFRHDVLECGVCGGRLRVRAMIVDPDVATKILESLAHRVGRGGTAARGPP